MQVDLWEYIFRNWVTVWDNFWWGQIVQGMDLTRDTMSRDELRWSEKACLDRGRYRGIVYTVHMDSIDKYIRGYISRLHVHNPAGIIRLKFLRSEI
jgi:hypothetical protein